MNNPAPTSEQPVHKPNAPSGAEVHPADLRVEQILTLWEQRIKPYANLIYAVVGGVVLVVLAGYYFQQQSQSRNDEAYQRLAEAKDVNELAAIEPNYAGTDAHPYLLFELACRRHDDAGHDPVKLKNTIAEFNRLAGTYPDHYLTGLVRARTREAEEDLKWVEELLPKKLTELDAMRKAYDDAGKPKDDGAKKEDGDGEKKGEDGKSGDVKKEEPGDGKTGEEKKDGSGGEQKSGDGGEKK